MAIIVPQTSTQALEQVAFNRTYVYLICTVTAFGGLLFGFDLVNISGTIPFFTQAFRLSEFQTGWAVGCINLGCVAGALLAGKLSDLLGRKRLLILCAFLFAFTGVGTGWASTFDLFIFFRMFSGVAVGAAALVCPIYTAEISPSFVRGRMVSFYQLAITSGIMLAYISNYLLLHTGVDNWRWMFSSQAIPALLFFAGLFFVPESPRWLVQKHRYGEAAKVLEDIGEAEYAKAEIEFIKATFQSSVKEKLSDLIQKNILPIVIVGVLVAVFSQIIGQNSIYSYAPLLFKQAGMAQNSAFLQSIILGAISFAATFVAIGTIDKIGRKRLLMIGSMLLFLDAALLSSAFLFHWSGVWILVFVLGFIAIYCASIGPVTWVALSEIFPNRIRGYAMGTATFALWIANFFTTASFPVMKAHLGLPGTFAVHATICLVYFFYVRSRVPETKGKSLEEIERALSPVTARAEL